ncbi:MAG: transposase family protein [Gammaproteobacteria bacterium]|nr:transposase family protein [Gammaproteobacteria bacterium]
MTYEFLSFFFDSDETTLMRSVKRIEKIAVRVVHIEKRREINREETGYPVSDAAEQPVQRPEKGQKKYYSGKQKRHTLKTQYFVGPDGMIYAVSNTYPGKTHDFRIYKEQKNRGRFPGIPEKGDSGHQGIRKYDSHAGNTL